MAAKNEDKRPEGGSEGSIIRGGGDGGGVSGLRPFGIKVVMAWTSPLKLAEGMGGAHEFRPHFRVIGDPIELMLQVLNLLALLVQKYKY